MRQSVFVGLAQEYLLTTRLTEAHAFSRRGRQLFPSLRADFPKLHPTISGEGEWSLLFGPVPIGERGGVDLEGKGLFGSIDGYGAEVGEAPRNDRLVFFGSPRGAVIGGYLWKIRTPKGDHIAAVGIYDQNAFRIRTECVGFVAA